MNLVDEFVGGNHGKNTKKKAPASTKRLTETDYLFFNYISHAVSKFVRNYAKNVSNYLTPDAKKAFNQLRQAFTKAPIL